MTEQFRIKFSVSVQNSITGDDGTRDVVIAFKSPTHYEKHNDTNFDHLIEPINEWLKNNHPYEYVDDCIEPLSEDTNDKVDIYIEE